MGKFMRNRTYRNYLVKCAYNMGNSLAKIDCSVYYNLTSDRRWISFHILLEYSDTSNFTKYRHIELYLWFDKERNKYYNCKIMVHSKPLTNLINIETLVFLVLEAIYFRNSNYNWNCSRCCCPKGYHQNHHDFDR